MDNFRFEVVHSDSGSYQYNLYNGLLLVHSKYTGFPLTLFELDHDLYVWLYYGNGEVDLVPNAKKFKNYEYSVSFSPECIELSKLLSDLGAFHHGKFDRDYCLSVSKSSTVALLFRDR